MSEGAAALSSEGGAASEDNGNCYSEAEAKLCSLILQQTSAKIKTNVRTDPGFCLFKLSALLNMPGVQARMANTAQGGGLDAQKENESRLHAFVDICSSEGFSPASIRAYANTMLVSPGVLLLPVVCCACLVLLSTTLPTRSRSLFTHIFAPHHWQGGSHPTVSKFATEVVKFFDEKGTRTSLMEHFGIENLAALEITGETTMAESEFSTATEHNSTSISMVQTQAHTLLPIELPPVKIDYGSRIELNMASKSALSESKASIKQVHPGGAKHISEFNTVNRCLF